MSVVLTVKVEGLIEPPLAQMASTKACYKLGLKYAGQNRAIEITFTDLLQISERRASPWKCLEFRQTIYSDDDATS